MGRLDATDTAALLVKALIHDRLGIYCDNLAIDLAFKVPLDLCWSGVEFKFIYVSAPLSWCSLPRSLAMAVW